MLERIHSRRVQLSVDAVRRRVADFEVNVGNVLLHPKREQRVELLLIHAPMMANSLVILRVSL